MLRLLRAGADEGRAVVMVTHERGRGRDRRPRAAARDGRLARDRARARRPAARAGAHAARRAGHRSRRRSSSAPARPSATGSRPASTAPPTQADLPDVIARFDRERRATRRRARARAAEPRGALLPPRASTAAAGRADGHSRAAARSRSCSAAGAATRSSTGRDLSPRPRRGRGRARPRARVGPARRATGSTSSGSATLRVVGHRGRRPTTSRSRWPAPRASTSTSGRARRVRLHAGDRPNIALLWLNDPATADVTLTQARAASFGIGRLQFVTRDGRARPALAGRGDRDLAARRVLARRAARRRGRCSPRARTPTSSGGWRVRRPARARLHARRRIAALQARRGGAGRACPRRRSGIALGALAVAGPSAALLAALNEQPPGLGAARRRSRPRLAGVVALVVAAATWPAWRAARRPPAEILRGGDLAGRRRPRRGAAAACSALGARFATAARGRWVAVGGRRSPSARAW